MTDDDLLRMAVRASALRSAMRRGELAIEVEMVPLPVLPSLVAALVHFWDAAEEAADSASADTTEACARGRAELEALREFKASASGFHTRLLRAERRYREQVQINQQQAARIAELRQRVKVAA